MASKRRRRHGSANVEEHPKGSGLYRVRAKIAGKLVTIASKLSRKQAIAVADHYGEERDSGSLREGITLAQFGPTFMELRKRRGGRSVSKDRNRWKNYVSDDSIGEIALLALRRSDVVEWRDRLLGKLEAQTVRNALNLLRVALGDALDRELVTVNVAHDVRVPRGHKKQEEDLSGVLLPAEQMDLLNAVPAKYQALVLVAMLTGLRWSELAYLRREDIRGDVLRISRSVDGGPTKSGKTRRVPLLPPARAALDRQIAMLSPGCQWVFPSRDGQPRKYRPSRWSKWIEAAGIARRVRWHDLRHTCGTSLLAGWWSTDGHRWRLDEVCSMLGHANQSTTEIYARKVDETLEKAAARMLVIEFPGGSGGPPNALKSGESQRLPKPKVTRSSRVGGAQENQTLSRSEPEASGNFRGTSFTRARARLEAVAKTVDDPKTRAAMACVRGVDAALRLGAGDPTARDDLDAALSDGASALQGGGQ